MFDIAWSELLLIAVLALIFIGPKELPQVLHTLGKGMAKLRRSADDFRRQFEDSMREAGYEDLHKNIQDFRSLNPANQLKASIDRAINQEYTPTPSLPSEQPPAQSTTEPAVWSAQEHGGVPSAPSNAIDGTFSPPVETIKETSAPSGEHDTHSSLPAVPRAQSSEPVKDHATPVV